MPASIVAPLLLLSSALAAEADLGLLTYNTWGLPRPALRDPSRFNRMEDKLRSLVSDDGVQVITLQEAFNRPVSRMIDALSPVLPFAGSGEGPGFLRLSAGLRTLTNLATGRVERHRYDACAGIDCIARKGALLVDVDVPGGLGTVLVANTHLNFAGPASLRLEQATQLTEWISAARGDLPVILAGDLNVPENDDAYRFLRDRLGLQDAWRSQHEAGSPDSEGLTYDTTTNRFADHSWGDGSRVDHVLFASGRDLIVEVRDARLAITGKDDSDRPCSDHYGVRVHFRVYLKEQ